VIERWQYLPSTVSISITPGEKHFCNFTASFPVIGFNNVISGRSLYEAVAEIVKHKYKFKTSISAMTDCFKYKRNPEKATLN